MKNPLIHFWKIHFWKIHFWKIHFWKKWNKIYLKSFS